ncbi:hypothetical protein HDA32_000805 [Spinactinospora alkalitolerans]|uniref:Uncharacterized protein n=1 Tax=Spinactinospora alkalitolerans TaxID=687207 RepID=A0A852TQ09_9ACTN|nr:hypothetical protein [Spinactinospora alkalitolerans]NYE45685.1 hypothetical protein [Spinactinospora alkalitolerans]
MPDATVIRRVADSSSHACPTVSRPNASLYQIARSGTARADLSPGDLVQLVLGIALSTARSGDAGQPGRLLAPVLDAVHGPGGRAGVRALRAPSASAARDANP